MLNELILTDNLLGPKVWVSKGVVFVPFGVQGGGPWWLFFSCFFFLGGGEVVSKKNVWEAIQFAYFCHFLYILELEMMQTIRATFLFSFSHGTCNVRDCPLMHVNPCLQQWVCGYWFNMVQS